jgi:hypothetical protein
MRPTAKCITCGLTLIVALQIAVPVAASGSGARLLRPDRTASFTATATVASGDPAPHVRSTNPRIQEVLRYALAKSESFRDLLATLDLVDRVVYVEEGTCRNPEHRSCLHLVADSPNIIVHIDPRQQIRSVVAQLAHELYHAAEIGREPDVVDAAGLLALYARIGERSCSSDACWETRAAVAFEALVRRQLVGRPAPE